MSKTNYLVKLSRDEILDIERNERNSCELQSCNEFYVIPNNEEKSITIVPKIRGAFLELSKEKSKVLVEIIQDCVKEW